MHDVMKTRGDLNHLIILLLFKVVHGNLLKEGLTIICEGNKKAKCTRAI